VLEHRGRLSARIESTGINPWDIGFAAFPRRLSGLVAPLLAGLPRQPVALSACCAVAGLGSEFLSSWSAPRIKRILSRYGAVRRLEVMSDLGALVETCLAERDGLVLIAGTGSVCVGVRHAGAGARSVQVGGRGGALDRGSGYWIGLKVLGHARRVRDRSAPASRTLMLVARRLGVPPQEVAADLARRRRDEIAGLVPDVLEAYLEGDRFARTVVEQAVLHLAHAAAEAKTRGKLRGRFEIHLAGGLFASPIVWDLFRRRVRRAAPLAIVRRAPEPLLGALRIAKSL